MKDDADLFRRALEDVVPLKKRAAKILGNKPAKRPGKPLQSRPQDLAAPRGRAAYDGRLDLHGYTQDSAYEALLGFLDLAQKRGWRRVLIITGRSGVLREVVPKWLSAPACRGRVETTGAARPADGGAGAIDVLIRKVSR